MANQAMVGLADAIEALRAEMMDAAARGWDQVMRFSIDPVELTVQVAVTKETDGKIGWKILEVSGEYEKVITQTLTLKLTPLWLQEDGTMTTNFAIASPTFPDDRVGPHQ